MANIRWRSALRVLAGAALLALGGITLSGCAFLGPKGGATAEELTAIVEETPGVQAAWLGTTGPYSGFARRNSPYFDLTLRPGYTVGNHGALLDWMLATAWSLNENRQPNGTVMLLVLDGTEEPVEWAWREAVEAHGFDADSVGEGFDEDGFLVFDAAEVEAILGPWPGAVPETPTNIFVLTE